MDENKLLERMARGDESALEELYDGYERRLYGFGLRLLGDEGLAEELVQETFVRLWKQAGRYDPDKASGKTFIFTVARRLAIDLFRRPSSRPLALEAEETNGNHTEHVVNAVVVHEAMSALSPAHRQVLELLHFQQLTQSEVAETLGIALGTVKTRAFHAVRALRKALEERGVDA